MSELPADVVERAARLTRRARETNDEETTRVTGDEREELLAEYDYAARVREEDDRSVLVCYPTEWLEDGNAAFERIEDTERAVEYPLSGPIDADWERLVAENDAIVEAVTDEYDAVHAANARALAEYAENHHGTTIERLTDDQLERFREEFYPRNVWPTDEQAAVVEESITLTLQKCESAADTPSASDTPPE